MRAITSRQRRTHHSPTGGRTRGGERSGRGRCGGWGRGQTCRTLMGSTRGRRLEMARRLFRFVSAPRNSARPVTCARQAVHLVGPNPTRASQASSSDAQRTHGQAQASARLAGRGCGGEEDLVDGSDGPLQLLPHPAADPLPSPPSRQLPRCTAAARNSKQEGAGAGARSAVEGRSDAEGMSSCRPADPPERGGFRSSRRCPCSSWPTPSPAAVPAAPRHYASLHPAPQLQLRR